MILTDAKFQQLQENYKIFWGRIHQKKYSEIESEVNIDSGTIMTRVQNFFPYLKSRRKRKQASKHIHHKYLKISDICLNDFLKEGFSQTEIANSCNCSRQAISDRIKRRNIFYMSEKELDKWKKYTKAYSLRIQGVRLIDIEEITGISLNKCFDKYFPELKTNGLGYKMYFKSYMRWIFPEHLAWQTKAYWYKIQGLKIKEICKRLNKSRELIGALSRDNPELKLKMGSWVK